MQARVVLADPPWPYADKSLHRGGAERHYRTMSLLDIADLDVRRLVGPDALCFMWTTGPMMPEALRVMFLWGFTYKTVAFTWIKRNRKTPSLFWGMGHWTRSNPEFVLLGVRGKPQRVARNVHSVVEAPVGAHSAKPEEVASRIMNLSPGPYVELFARQPREGWLCLGDAINGQTIEAEIAQSAAAATDRWYASGDN